MRRWNITSEVVLVALVTSMYCSGIGMILLSARTVWHSVERDDGKCRSLRWTRNHFLLHHHLGDESWSGGGDPSDSPERFPCSSPRSGLFQVTVDLLRTWSPRDNLTVPSAIGKIKFHHFLGANTSLALSLLAWISDASIFSQFLNVCDQNVSSPDSFRVQYITEEYSW